MEHNPKYDTEFITRFLAKNYGYDKKAVEAKNYIDADLETTAYSFAHSIVTKFVEAQEEAIMKEIHSIGNDLFTVFTIDKKQVADILRKAKSEKVREGFHKCYDETHERARTDNHYYCPNCGKLLRTVKTVDGCTNPVVDISGKMEKHCPDCGQKLDWAMNDSLEKKEFRSGRYPWGVRAFSVPVKTMQLGMAVLSNMKRMIDIYGAVSVADMKEFAGCRSEEADHNFGWTSTEHVNRAVISVNTDHSYTLTMPNARPI